MADTNKTMRQVGTILATGLSIFGVGLGMLLAKWHPVAGVVLMALGYLYLLWELLTCDPVVRIVPEGMLRILAGVMIIAFTILVAGPDIQRTLRYPLAKDANKNPDNSTAQTAKGPEKSNEPRQPLVGRNPRHIIPTSPSAPSVPVEMLCRDPHDCPTDALKKRVLELADHIEDTFKPFKDLRDEFVRLETTDRKESTEERVSDHQKTLHGHAVIAVGMYTDKYQKFAIAYRKEMLARIGPDPRGSAWPAEWYDLSVTGSVNSLPTIANDLRELARMLPKTGEEAPVPHAFQEPPTSTYTHKRHNTPPQPVVEKLIPSLDVMFDVGGLGVDPAFNFTNHATTNLYLWGDKLDGGPKSVDAPRVITPTGSYHIWAKETAAEFRRRIGSNGPLTIPFNVYVSTEDKIKHIIKYLVWAKIENGVLRVEVQNMGMEDADFTLPENY